MLTLEQCPFPQIEVLKGDGSPHTDCDNFRKWTIDQVAAIHPDLVVISTPPARSAGWSVNRRTMRHWNLWKPGLSASLDGLTGHAGAVVVLAAPPNTGNLLKCATQLSVPADCEGSAVDPVRRTWSARSGEW